MILIPCPWCGPRNSSEFAHAGERRPRPGVGDATPAAWRAYLYERRNPAGWTSETWYHRFGCRKFIAVERHTVSGEVRAAAPAAPPGPDREGFGEPGTGAPMDRGGGG